MKFTTVLVLGLLSSSAAIAEAPPPAATPAPAAATPPGQTMVYMNQTYNITMTGAMLEQLVSGLQTSQGLTSLQERVIEKTIRDQEIAQAQKAAPPPKK